MKKLVLLFLTVVIFTLTTMSFVWAGDDENPYIIIVKDPPAIGAHK